MPLSWTLENALTIIREISKIAKQCGYSVALYGSVLERGYSEKDLDLFFISQDPGILDKDRCLKEIEYLPEVRRLGSVVDVANGHCVVIWLKDGRHIDAQFRT